MSLYFPLFELTRGETVESIHHGAVAVVSGQGKLIASFGDPFAITYLRSTAKPFQALPFLESGGQEYFNLTPREIALICASHAGTDEHLATALTIQRKTGVSEADLLCGIHPLSHEPTIESMLLRNEPLTPNRHNCSGKHTGMLAYARMLGEQTGQDFDGKKYIDLEHPIQAQILNTLGEMCCLPVNEIGVGIDGCSAPNFAMPLFNAAWGYARMCDPESSGVAPDERRLACRTITSAMSSHPLMVSGPGHFDTRLMEVAQGRLISKGGAEGYQGIGLLPNALKPGSPALGIAYKIADGDARGKVRAAVALEVLRQLGALNSDELQALSVFGPGFPILNWRKFTVGFARPIFKLEPTG